MGQVWFQKGSSFTFKQNVVPTAWYEPQTCSLSAELESAHMGAVSGALRAAHRVPPHPGLAQPQVQGFFPLPPQRGAVSSGLWVQSSVTLCAGASITPPGHLTSTHSWSPRRDALSLSPCTGSSFGLPRRRWHTRPDQGHWSQRRKQKPTTSLWELSSLPPPETPNPLPKPSSHLGPNELTANSNEKCPTIRTNTTL